MYIAKDLVNEILDRLGWPQIESIEDPNLSARHRKVLRIVNRATKILGTYSDWPTLRTAGSILLVAYETSDLTAGLEQYVTATADSDTITVDNIVFDETYIGRAIVLSPQNYVYTIVAVPAPDTLQLHRPWIGDSVVPADAATFTLASDQYALPDDFDRFSDKAQNAFQPMTIEGVDPPTFAKTRRREPGLTLDDPMVFTVYGLNAGQTNQLVHFHPYPKFQRLLSYDYQRLHPEITSNNDKVLYPVSAISILIDAILEIVNGDLEADDTKVARVLDRLMRTYNTQQSHLGPTANRVELRPTNATRIAFRRMGARVKVDWGEQWDRAEDRLD
jgi:hypothetical protein